MDEIAKRECLHEWFARSAAAHRDRIAVTEGDKNLTYGEIDLLSTRFARRLRSAGADRGTLVAIIADRTVDTIVAILAVLKAGSAYLPLDPAHPPARLRGILADSGCRLIVGRESDRELARSRGGTLIRLDSDDPTADTDTVPLGGDIPPGGADPGDVAYVIYTSGSTGRPKGVAVTHANVTRLFRATEETFQPTCDDVWSLFHSFAFDFSVWELWGALLYGGRVVLIPYVTSRDPDAFFRSVLAEQVTVLSQTPSAFRRLIGAVAVAGYPAIPLRLVIFGGERLDPAVLRSWVEEYGEDAPRLVNMYGITETTVHVTVRDITAADLDQRTSPIGRPLADLRVYVLDESLRPVAAGATGEMYVGGAGVSTGYLGRPGLTADRFVPDPFGGHGMRMYRTGDLAIRGPGEELVFCGRTDDQVQLRGFRVELGEVEAVLKAQPGVREAAVVARAGADGEQRLIGYVAGTGEGTDPDRLRAALADLLPGYMIPASFVSVAQLPITVNGKVDQAALPPPPVAPPNSSQPPDSQDRDSQDRDSQAPPATAEQALARIFAQVLLRTDVDPDESFFALGGDSMIALQVISQARQAGLPISMTQLYAYPSAAGLASELASSPARPAAEPAPDAAAPLPQAAGVVSSDGVRETYPSTAMQVGIIYASEISEDPTLYHDLTSVRLAGPCDASALRRALDVVSGRHEVLRTSFDLDGDLGPLQHVHEAAAIPLTSEPAPAGDHRGALRAWWREQRLRSFDVTTAPLARCHLLEHADGSYDVAMSLHHAIADGWSFAVIIADLLLAYDRELGGGDPLPPMPTARFRDRVLLEQQALQSEATRGFWADVFAANPPQAITQALPMSTPRRDDQQGGDVDPDVRVPVPPDLIRGARSIAQSLGVPPKSVFLAADLWALSRLADRADVVTGISVNGRPEAEGADQIAGLFLNCVPVHARVGRGTWSDLIREVFAAEQRLLPHRRYPFAQMWRDLGGPAYHCSFNYVDFHTFDRLAALRTVKPLDWWFSDRSEFTLAVGVERRPRSPDFDVVVRADWRYLEPAVAATAAELFLAAVADIVANPAGACTGPAEGRVGPELTSPLHMRGGR
jgi:amino acid adenylation domain-containing protein